MSKKPPSALVATPEAAHDRSGERPEVDLDTTKRVARRLLARMLREPKLQAVIIAFALVLAGTYVAVPWIFKETLRWVFDEPEELRERFGLSPFEGVLVGAGAIALVALTFYVTMALRMFAVNVLSERVVFALRADIYAHVLRLHMGYFDKTKLGRILSRSTSDIAAVRNAIAQVIPRTLIHCCEGLFLGVLMLLTDAVLAAAVFAVGPFLWLANAYLRKRLHRAYRDVQESHSRITANVAETVSGIRVTQAFAREERNESLFHALTLFHADNNMRAARIHGVYIPVFATTNILVTAIIIAFGGSRVLAGEMLVSDLIGFFFFTGGFFMSVIILAELYNTTLQAMAGGERIFALLDTEPEIADAPDAIDLPRASHGARIEFTDVTFGYDPDKPVLKGVSFAAEPDTTLALVGHTGSGKTSIVSLIARFYAHQSGSITVDGHPIESLTQDSLHKQTGLVLQDNFLFAGTVADNIRFARPDATDDEVRAACEDLGCLDVLEALPDGLGTQVGERGTHLSLGQRQLACFARAMLARPRILMLDEATASVDTFTEHRVQTALERLTAGRTSIVVAHRLSTVRRADTILVLEQGRITERGTHSELLAQEDSHYKSLYDEFLRLSSGE